MLPIVKLRKMGICSANAGKTLSTIVSANIIFEATSWSMLGGGGLHKKKKKQQQEKETKKNPRQQINESI